MNYMDIYNKWLNDEYFDENFRQQLKNLPKDEIEDAFFKDLEFGTAGLRGILGAGRNRMNKYIIRRATQGYANFLLTKNSENPTCVIAHDVRHFSEEFSHEAASVLVANGIKTYLFNGMRSTPELSFAVRHLNTTGGIVITASHNPKNYNGYKVYGSNGGQLIPKDADALTAMVEEVDNFQKIKYMDFEKAKSENLIIYLDENLDDIYLDAVCNQIIHKEAYQYPLKTAFTPMHGVASQIMPKLFDKLSIPDIYPVKSQMIPDPDFSTVYKPNPEEEGAFKVGIEFAKENDCELIIGTDPDSDRMAIVVKDRDNNFVQLNGNEIGSLFTYYVLSETKNLPKNPKIVKTVVTGDLPFAIADKFNVEYDETLTGFKFIGDMADKYEANGENFILGFEEAIGFLIGQHARDKDGVVATMLAIEMSRFYAKQGKNLIEVLDDIYKQFGYYVAQTVSKVYEGIEGMHIIQSLMKGFRDGFIEEYQDADKIVSVTDFKQLKKFDLINNTAVSFDMDKSDVLKYRFESGNWICVRPSGTEPKIKFYYCISAPTLDASNKRLDELKNFVENFSKKILKK